MSAELVAAALSAHGRRLVVLNDSEVTDDLVRDMTEVLTSLCARLYGRRSARNSAEKALRCTERDMGPMALSDWRSRMAIELHVKMGKTGEVQTQKTSLVVLPCHRTRRPSTARARAFTQVDGPLLCFPALGTVLRQGPGKAPLHPTDPLVRSLRSSGALHPTRWPSWSPPIVEVSRWRSWRCRSG